MFDPDGYTVIIDGKLNKPIAINALVIFNSIEAGNHTVMLDGLEKNCSVVGDNPRSITINTGGAGATTFSVSIRVACVVKTGTLRVNVQTTGLEPDVDGYRVVTTGMIRGVISGNATAPFEVPVGQWRVSLDGVSGNCLVDEPAAVQVSIPFNASVDVSFVVRCVQAAYVDVSTSTTGVDLDYDGYTVQIAPADRALNAYVNVVSNGTTAGGPFVPGTYTLSLLDLAPNCDPIIPSPRTVTLAVGRNPILAEVKCAIPAQIAFTGYAAATPDIFIINSNGTQVIRLTQHPSSDFDPVWSPDGRRIAFTSDRDGLREIYVMEPDGSSVTRLTNGGGEAAAWSPDGHKILFTSMRSGNAELYTMNADGTSVVRLTSEPGSDHNGVWSPNGGQIAFQTNRGGDWDVYVMNADGSNQTRLTTSLGNDEEPAWSPDGSTIAYIGTFSQTSVSDIYLVTPAGVPISRLNLQDQFPRSPSWSADGKKIAVSGATTCYYYYYDYCDHGILIVEPNGIQRTSIRLATMSAVASPSWRP